MTSIDTGQTCPIDEDHELLAMELRNPMFNCHNGGSVCNHQIGDRMGNMTRAKGHVQLGQ